MAYRIPFIIGAGLGLTLFYTIGWWGFLVIFPWIGLSVSLGIYLASRLPKEKKGLGRKISILMIMPSLLLFVPLANKENFQLEGVILIVLAGYFSKGFIHYAVAKLFGPLIWGRGFCGWACWTAAVLDWMPVRKKAPMKAGWKRLRYISLAVSASIPLALVFAFHYDVRAQYIGKAELSWMLAGNAVYYLLAIPMAFIFSDKRAFCKIACPVSLVMKAPASLALIRKKPSNEKCIECGVCNRACPMDVDVMSYIAAGEKVRDTECVICNECKSACPAGAIR